MTATTLEIEAPTALAGPGTVATWWREVKVMTRRNLIHVAREPMQLSDVTIQPVIFTVMFIYVFGAAMVIPGGSYKDFALGGLLTMNLTTSSVGTAVGLSTDLRTGVIDRFRTLPIFGNTILVGRALSDLLAATVCATIVGITGYAIGWRPDAGVLSVLGGFGIAILFGFAMSWLNAVLGLRSDDPESAQAVAFLAIFPLAFLSSAFAPTQKMPAVIRFLADWNPVSAVAGATRNLFGNPNPQALQDAWPCQHPVAAAIFWSLLMLAVCIPMAARRYRKRTAD
jgi:ABC transporter DrrB family efflux protein